MADDSYDMTGVTIEFTGMVDAIMPKIITKIENDSTIAAAFVRAAMPEIIRQMVIYFRANPPAAAPQPKNFFGF